ncbi:hypothetical protein DIPPA_29259 [Diplonema papillatum]|nr:hypothetical protein DIPPA_29259 [Diplonema papillatum]
MADQLCPDCGRQLNGSTYCSKSGRRHASAASSPAKKPERRPGTRSSSLPQRLPEGKDSLGTRSISPKRGGVMTVDDAPSTASPHPVPRSLGSYQPRAHTVSPASSATLAEQHQLNLPTSPLFAGLGSASLHGAARRLEAAVHGTIDLGLDLASARSAAIDAVREKDVEKETRLAAERQVHAAACMADSVRRANEQLQRVALDEKARADEYQKEAARLRHLLKLTAAERDYTRETAASVASRLAASGIPETEDEVDTALRTLRGLEDALSQNKREASDEPPADPSEGTPPGDDIATLRDALLQERRSRAAAEERYHALRAGSPTPFTEEALKHALFEEKRTADAFSEALEQERAKTRRLETMVRGRGGVSCALDPLPPPPPPPGQTSPADAGAAAGHATVNELTRMLSYEQELRLTVQDELAAVKAQFEALAHPRDASVSPIQDPSSAYQASPDPPTAAEAALRGQLLKERQRNAVEEQKLRDAVAREQDKRIEAIERFVGAGAAPPEAAAVVGDVRRALDAENGARARLEEKLHATLAAAGASEAALRRQLEEEAQRRRLLEDSMRLHGSPDRDSLLKAERYLAEEQAERRAAEQRYLDLLHRGEDMERRHEAAVNAMSRSAGALRKMLADEQASKTALQEQVLRLQDRSRRSSSAVDSSQPDTPAQQLLEASRARCAELEKEAAAQQLQQQQLELQVQQLQQQQQQPQHAQQQQPQAPGNADGKRAAPPPPRCTPPTTPDACDLALAGLSAPLPFSPQTTEPLDRRDADEPGEPGEPGEPTPADDALMAALLRVKDLELRLLAEEERRLNLEDALAAANAPPAGTADAGAPVQDQPGGAAEGRVAELVAELEARLLETEQQRAALEETVAELQRDALVVAPPPPPHQQNAALLRQLAETRQKLEELAQPAADAAAARGAAPGDDAQGRRRDAEILMALQQRLDDEIRRRVAAEENEARLRGAAGRSPSEIEDVYQKALVGEQAKRMELERALGAAEATQADSSVSGLVAKLQAAEAEARRWKDCFGDLAARQAPPPAPHQPADGAADDVRGKLKDAEITITALRSALSEEQRKSSALEAQEKLSLGGRPAELPAAPPVQDGAYSPTTDACNLQRRVTSLQQQLLAAELSACDAREEAEKLRARAERLDDAAGRERREALALLLPAAGAAGAACDAEYWKARAAAAEDAALHDRDLRLHAERDAADLRAQLEAQVGSFKKTIEEVEGAFEEQRHPLFPDFASAAPETETERALRCALSSEQKLRSSLEEEYTSCRALLDQATHHSPLSPGRCAAFDPNAVHSTPIADQVLQYALGGEQERRRALEKEVAVLRLALQDMRRAADRQRAERPPGDADALVLAALAKAQEAVPEALGAAQDAVAAAVDEQLRQLRGDLQAAGSPATVEQVLRTALASEQEQRARVERELQEALDEKLRHGGDAPEALASLQARCDGMEQEAKSLKDHVSMLAESEDLLKLALQTSRDDVARLRAQQQPSLPGDAGNDGQLERERKARQVAEDELSQHRTFAALNRREENYRKRLADLEAGKTAADALAATLRKDARGLEAENKQLRGKLSQYAAILPLSDIPGSKPPTPSNRALTPTRAKSRERLSNTDSSPLGVSEEPMDVDRRTTSRLSLRDVNGYKDEIKKLKDGLSQRDQDLHQEKVRVRTLQERLKEHRLDAKRQQAEKAGTTAELRYLEQELAVARAAAKGVRPRAAREPPRRSASAAAPAAEAVRLAGKLHEAEAQVAALAKELKGSKRREKAAKDAVLIAEIERNAALEEAAKAGLVNDAELQRQLHAALLNKTQADKNLGSLRRVLAQASDVVATAQQNMQGSPSASPAGAPPPPSPGQKRVPVDIGTWPTPPLAFPAGASSPAASGFGHSSGAGAATSPALSPARPGKPGYSTEVAFDDATTGEAHVFSVSEWLKGALQYTTNGQARPPTRRVTYDAIKGRLRFVDTGRFVDVAANNRAGLLAELKTLADQAGVPHNITVPTTHNVSLSPAPPEHPLGAAFVPQADATEPATLL